MKEPAQGEVEEVAIANWWTCFTRFDQLTCRAELRRHLLIPPDLQLVQITTCPTGALPESCAVRIWLAASELRMFLCAFVRMRRKFFRVDSVPKRPKSHQLEAKSLLALQTRLPSSWFFREEHRDYGIDASIEVFTPDGDPTGLRFLVQLKSTAKGSDKPRVRLRTDTVAYFRSLALPVLIVLYEEDRDRLLARWFHEFDPYYGGVGENWITFTFKEENIWSAGTPENLV